MKQITILTSIIACIILFLSCQTQKRKRLVEQTFKSNEACTFRLDGEKIGSGKKVTEHITGVPHTITCRAHGYRRKVKEIEPPYGRFAIKFTFMVEDKTDAPISFREKHQREKEQRDKEAMGGLFKNYGKLATTLARYIRPAISGSKIVAVTGFRSKDRGRKTRMASRLQDEIITELVRLGVKVVMRNRLNVVFKEMALHKSGLIDPSKAAEIGRAAGATHIVTGTYADFRRDGIVRLYVKVVEVESMTIVKTYSASLLRTGVVIRDLRRR